MKEKNAVKNVLVDTHQNEEKDRAWVTRVLGDSYNTTMLVGAQVLSIQKYSRYKTHVSLVGEHVSTRTRSTLEKFGSQVVDLASPWDLTDFSQVALLENSAFLSDASADDMFHECTSGICASEYSDGDAGTLVVRPNADVYERMSDESSNGELSLDSLPSFLQDDLQPLDWKYDSCSSVYLRAVERCLESSHSPNYMEPNMEFVECLNLFTDVNDISIASSQCGTYSYLYEPLCVWWETSSERCELGSLRKFQEDLVQMNECALAGQSQETCESSDWKSMCHWCGEHTRCIPINEACEVDSKETKRLVAMKQHVLLSWDRKTDPRVGNELPERNVEADGSNRYLSVSVSMS